MFKKIWNKNWKDQQWQRSGGSRCSTTCQVNLFCAQGWGSRNKVIFLVFGLLRGVGEAGPLKKNNSYYSILLNYVVGWQSRSFLAGLLQYLTKKIWLVSSKSFAYFFLIKIQFLIFFSGRTTKKITFYFWASLSGLGTDFEEEKNSQ